MESLTPDQEQQNIHDIIVKAAAEKLSQSTSDKPMSTETLIKSIQSISHIGAINVGTIYKHILDASKSGEENISSRKGRGGGYFIERKIANITDPDDAQPIAAQTDTEKTAEKHLWPLAADWLRQEKQLRQVTHDLANLKSGGYWSIPM